MVSWLIFSLIRIAAAACVALAALVCSQTLQAQDSTEAKVPIRIIEVRSEQQARDLIERIRAGADFAQLAKEYSIYGSAGVGGYLGELQPSFLSHELRDALKGVKPGQCTQPVQIQDGWAFLQLLDKPPADADASSTSALPLAARGKVRYAAEVSGYGEALLVRRSQVVNIPGWEHDLHAACEARTRGVPAAIGRLRKWAAEPGIADDERSARFYTLGQLMASQEGGLDDAIAAWQQGYQLALSIKHPIADALREALATAYLHRASIADRSTEGGVDPSRLFPSMPGGLHPLRADLDKAIELYRQAVDHDPDNLELKWLLNVAYMSAGMYADRIPAKYRIAPDKLKSKERVGRFVDIGPSAGLHIPTMAGGIIADDFDNDGLIDLMVSQMDDCAPLRFFHNNGDGTFTDRSAAAGLSDQLGGLTILQADYNNDGCMDVLVLRGGWEFPRRLSLLRNNCNGTFTDVTAQSGLGAMPTSTQAAVWTDIDNDGNLDLFVANENSPAQLFLNKGDGTFVDIAHAAGVDQVSYAKAAITADYDNDGYPDLFVSNEGGDNFLYHNNGNRTFTEVGKQAGVREPWKSFGAAFFDFDNDGLTDLFVTSYYTSTEEFARGVLGLPRNAESMKLYKNRGDGAFDDVTAKMGLDRAVMPMGMNFGDIDNDGYLDLYLGSGNPSYTTAVPNVMFRNDAGVRFSDVTASSGTGAMEKGHGIAFADFTNTGHEDIAVVMGGATPGDRHSIRLFENPGNANDWLTVHLVGTKTNRAGIGARIKVTVQNGTAPPRFIWRTAGSGGSFGCSPIAQHIGLGPAARILSVEVFWPVSHTAQKFSSVPIDRAIEITELSDSFRTLNPKQFHYAVASSPRAGTKP